MTRALPTAITKTMRVFGEGRAVTQRPTWKKIIAKLMATMLIPAAASDEQAKISADNWLVTVSTGMLGPP